MNMQNYTIPFANTGDTEEFSIDTDPTGKVSLEKGWTELYQLRPEEGGLFILRKVFNQMMKLVSTDTVTWKTQSFPNWINDKGDGTPYAYPKNAIVKYTNGNNYVSLINNNTQVPTGANWKIFDITALDNTVKLTGNQTIAGVKTFSSTIAGSINGNSATVTNGVYTTGNQTISGTKTFSINPISSATQSTAVNALTRKDYVDGLDTQNVKKSANLSDLANKSTARTNLGLGTAATRDVGTTAGQVMQVGAFGLGAVAGNLEYFGDVSGFGYINSNPALGAAGPFIRVGAARGFTISARGKIVAVQTTGQEGDPILTLHHTGNILTTTGQSTIYPMTQKAVTDAINNTAIGVGQTWQDVTGSRALGTTYTNSSGKPIEVFVTVNNTSSDGNYYISITIGGVLRGRQAASASYGTPGNQYASAQFIVPNGITYSVASSRGSLAYWQELR